MFSNENGATKMGCSRRFKLNEFALNDSYLGFVPSSTTAMETHNIVNKKIIKLRLALKIFSLCNRAERNSSRCKSSTTCTSSNSARKRKTCLPIGDHNLYRHIAFKKFKRLQKPENLQKAHQNAVCKATLAPGYMLHGSTP